LFRLGGGRVTVHEEQTGIYWAVVER
jgi:hypothetical protein